MKSPGKTSFGPEAWKLDQKSPFGVSGGQVFPPKIPSSFTEHLYRALSKIDILVSPCTAMQNHMEIMSKFIVGPEMCEI